MICFSMFGFLDLRFVKERFFDHRLHALLSETDQHLKNPYLVELHHQTNRQQSERKNLNTCSRKTSLITEAVILKPSRSNI